MTGAYAFLLLFVVALSGKMIFGLLTMPSIGLGASGGFGSAASAVANAETVGGPVSIDALVATAREKFPNDRIRDLSYIRLNRAVAVVTFIDRDSPNVRALNRVFFQRHSGEVISVQDWDDLAGIPLAEDWAFPIHSGEILGSLGQFLVLLSGLVMPFLFITGAWLWVKKRKSGSPV